MKNETFTPTDEIVEKMYSDFCSDESILSMSALRRKYGYGSKSGRKIQLAIYAKYGEKEVKLEANRRLGKYRYSKVTGTYTPSKETLLKRGASFKKTYWSRTDLQKTAIENGRMSFGRVQSDEEKEKRANSLRGLKRTDATKKKMSLSQKGKSLSIQHRKALCVPKSVIPMSYVRSDETKKKLSDICKKQWLDGTHKATYISKGQRQLFDALSLLGHNVKLEHIVQGRPFDVWMVGTKTVFEFNGTYWHRDPRRYAPTPEVESVLKNDREKLDIAQKNGYSVIVVWQSDWESATNKIDFTSNLLKQNGY